MHKSEGMEWFSITAALIIALTLTKMTEQVR